MRFLLALCLMSFMMVSCKSSKSTATSAEIEALGTLVEAQKFIIESEWAYPQATNAMSQVLNSGLLPPGSNSGAINLIGNANFLKISGDSIYSYLPYFGERQMQVAYGGMDSAIEFKGVMENYTATKNEDNSYTILCEAKSNSENFNVMIRLYPNLKSELNLRGASRFQIQYSGEVEAISEMK
ncbi:DUF4251 domain-containing protein [Algibacter sp. 2305UL17-15]|uniref:DUF4251 domain-containing protein n=1 Tax=Algibacter sp. 2305UL17-15 TaxID=3231268 RepID=UPI003459B770